MGWTRCIRIQRTYQLKHSDLLCWEWWFGDPGIRQTDFSAGLHSQLHHAAINVAPTAAVCGQRDTTQSLKLKKPKSV